MTCSPKLYQSYLESGVGMVPLGAVLNISPGSIGGRQPANTTMRPHMVVVVAPEAQHRAGKAERHELCIGEARVPHADIEEPNLAILQRHAPGSHPDRETRCPKGETMVRAAL